jgi:hypothetical protein
VELWSVSKRRESKEGDEELMKATKECGVDVEG